MCNFITKYKLLCMLCKQKHTFENHSKSLLVDAEMAKCTITVYDTLLKNISSCYFQF